MQSQSNTNAKQSNTRYKVKSSPLTEKKTPKNIASFGGATVPATASSCAAVAPSKWDNQQEAVSIVTKAVTFSFAGI